MLHLTASQPSRIVGLEKFEKRQSKSRSRTSRPPCTGDKSMADFKALQAEMSKHSADMGLNLTRVVMKNADAMVKMNVSFAENTVELARKNMEALAEARDVNAVMGLYQNMVKTLVESAMRYGSSVYDANSKTAANITDVVEQGISGIAEQVTTAVDDIASQSGQTPVEMVDAVKHTAASARAAFTEITQVARKVTRMADENVAAVAKAAHDAIDSGLRH
ncbi:MAG: phasin family protein [Betaproteobacteria bacterium]|nr:phasin family protein [Betaproteobacteria bacterium]